MECPKCLKPIISFTYDDDGDIESFVHLSGFCLESTKDAFQYHVKWFHDGPVLPYVGITIGRGTLYIDLFKCRWRFDWRGNCYISEFGPLSLYVYKK